MRKPTPFIEISRALVMKLVADKYQSREPEIFFAELCKLHGLEAETAIRVFHETSSLNFDGNERDKRIRDIITGPTFLDVPNPHGQWRFSYEFTEDLRVRAGQSFDAESISHFPLNDIPYFFNILPRFAQRDIAKTIGPISVDDTAFLTRLRTEVLRYIDPTKTFPEPPQQTDDDIGDLFARRRSIKGVVETRAEAMAEGDRLEDAAAHPAFQTMKPSRPANYRHFILGRMGNNLEVTQKQYDLLRTEKNDLMFASLAATRLLKAVHEDAAADVTPHHVYMQLGGAPKITDPLLHAASKKMLQGLSSIAGWDTVLYWQSQIQEPDHSAIALKVIEKWKALNSPIITLPQLAKELGVFTPDLLRIITAENAAKNCWRNQGGIYVVNPTFAALCVWLGEKPEDIVAPPLQTKPARAEVTAVKPKDEPLQSPWQAMGAERAQELFGAQFDTPQAVIEKALAFMNPPRAQEQAARAALTTALQNPDDYMYGHGHPSLPHLWLMWALDPATHKDFSPNTVFTALEVTFQAGRDDIALTKALYASQGTAQGAGQLNPQAALAWAAVTTAHGQKEGDASEARITSYADFLRWNGMNEPSDDKAHYRWGELLAFADKIQTDDGLPQRPRASERDKNRTLGLQLQGIVQKVFSGAHKAQPWAGLYGSQTRAQAVCSRLEPYIS